MGRNAACRCWLPADFQGGLEQDDSLWFITDMVFAESLLAAVTEEEEEGEGDEKGQRRPCQSGSAGESAPTSGL